MQPTAGLLPYSGAGQTVTWSLQASVIRGCFWIWILSFPWGAFGSEPTLGTSSALRELVLYAQDRCLPAKVRMAGGFQSELLKEGAGARGKFEEYLDGTHFPGPRQAQALEEHLRARCAESPPKVLVTFGDLPFAF